MGLVRVAGEDEEILDVLLGDEAAWPDVKMLVFHHDWNSEVLCDFDVHVVRLKAATVARVEQFGEGRDGFLNITNHEGDMNHMRTVRRHPEGDRPDSVRLSHASVRSRDSFD